MYTYMYIHMYTDSHVHMSNVENIYQYSLFHVELNEYTGRDKSPKVENSSQITSDLPSPSAYHQTCD